MCFSAVSPSLNHFKRDFTDFTYELLRNDRKSWCGEMILLGKDTHLQTILNSVTGCLNHASIKEGLGTTRYSATLASLHCLKPKNPKKQAMKHIPSNWRTQLLSDGWLNHHYHIPRKLIEVDHVPRFFLPSIFDTWSKTLPSFHSFFFPKSIEWSPGCRWWCHLWGAEFWFAGVVPGPDRSPAGGPWKSTKMVVGSQWIMGLTMNYEVVHQNVLYTKYMALFMGIWRWFNHRW